jgi:hypothetical protein
VLEALYRATGRPIVADYYTKLFRADTVQVQNRPLAEVLNQLAEAMGMRWSRDGSWLQLRSATFYDDRLKEVPNRLLARWAARRREHGALTIEELMEIVRLPDAQLDAASMAEGAKEIWGLAEWDIARPSMQRPHFRYLAEFSPAQRQEAMSASGLEFAKMNLSQQQRFLSLALASGGEPLASLDEMAGATLRVDYRQPGWFEWRTPNAAPAFEWVVPLAPGSEGKRVLRPPVRERTREAARQAARRLDPSLVQALREALGRIDPRLAGGEGVEEPEIVPTSLSLTMVYIPGLTNQRSLHVLREHQDLTTGTR